MKKNEIDRDPQLAALLQGSFADRTPEEADRFTRRVVRSLPQRRRKSVLTWLLAYIQSPFWLVTAAVLCLLLLASRADYIMERFDSLPTLILVVILSVSTAALFALDMLRDAERMHSTSTNVF